MSLQESTIVKKVYTSLSLLSPVSFSPKIRNAFIELTNNCNLRCKMCFGGRRPKGFMDFTLFKKIMDELSTIHVDWIALHYGGESLLHPKFKDMLIYAHKKIGDYSKIGWQTNGMLFNEKIAELVVDLGIDFVGFSVDGLGNVNDSIRKGASYATVENNILRLLEIRGDSLKPNVYLNLTNTGQGRAKIDAFVKYWIEKVDWVTENPSINEFLQVQSLRNYYKGSLVTTNKKCYSPFSTMGIFWNGDVVGCCRDINGTDVMGNVKRKGVKAVWQSPKIKALRKACLQNKFPKNSPCRLCDVWKTRFVPFKTFDDDMLIEYDEQTIKYSKR